MKKLFLTLIVAGLFFFPVNALAQKLVFATTEWPPYVMSENGKVIGLDIEIVLELCKRLGFEADIQMTPWKRTLRHVEEGVADAIIAARYTKERAEFLYYPSEPLQIEKTVIFAHKGSGMKINKIDDLKGKVIGTVRGYAYGPDFDRYQGLKRKEECNNDRQMVRIFAKKRIFLMAGSDEGTMKYLCRKEGVETEVVYVLNETPSYIAFSKTRGEKGRVMAEQFGQMLHKLKEDGVIKKIESRYF